MTLLRFVGCTAPSHEYTAALGGDQVVGQGRGDMTDPTRPGEALAFLASLSSGLPAWRRPGAFFHGLAQGREVARVGIRADCEVAVRMAQRFDLPIASPMHSMNPSSVGTAMACRADWQAMRLLFPRAWRQSPSLR
jgi:hypothetical protein